MNQKTSEAALIGLGIATARYKKGVTQVELANALGIDVSTVSRWEKGVCRPRDRMKIKLSQYFGIEDMAFTGFNTEALVQSMASNTCTDSPEFLALKTERDELKAECARLTETLNLIRHVSRLVG